MAITQEQIERRITPEYLEKVKEESYQRTKEKLEQEKAQKKVEESKARAKDIFLGTKTETKVVSGTEAARIAREQPQPMSIREDVPYTITTTAHPPPPDKPELKQSVMPPTVPSTPEKPKPMELFGIYKKEQLSEQKGPGGQPLFTGESINPDVEFKKTGNVGYAALGLAKGVGESFVGFANFFSPVNLETGKSQVPIIEPAISTVKSIPSLPSYASENPYQFIGNVGGMFLLGKGVKELKTPSVSVSKVSGKTKVLTEGEFTKDFGVVDVEVVSSNLGRTKTYTVEGFSASRSKVIADNVYARYGEIGFQVLKDDSVKANIRGKYGGLGKVSDSKVVERGAVLLEQEGKTGIKVLDVGSISKSDKAGFSRVLSADVLYRDLSKPGTPQSVTFGISRELYGIEGGASVYEFKGAGVSGKKGLKLLGEGYKETYPFKIDKASGFNKEFDNAGMVLEQKSSGTKTISELGTVAVTKAAKNVVIELEKPRISGKEAFSIVSTANLNEIPPLKVQNVPKDAQMTEILSPTKTRLFTPMKSTPVSKSKYSETLAYDVTSFYPQTGMARQIQRQENKELGKNKSFSNISSVSKLKAGSTLASALGLGSVASIRSGLSLSQSLGTKQLTKLKTKQLLRQEQISRNQLLPLSLFNVKSFYSNKGFKDYQFNIPRSGRKRLFDVFVRESKPKGKGKIKEYLVGRGVGKSEALNLGISYADLSTARTFRIVPRGLGYSKDVKLSKDILKFRGRKGRSKLPSTSFVEKSKYAIDTPGERKGITLKGLISKRRKKNWRLLGL